MRVRRAEAVDVELGADRTALALQLEACSAAQRSAGQRRAAQRRAVWPADWIGLRRGAQRSRASVTVAFFKAMQRYSGPPPLELAPAWERNIACAATAPGDLLLWSAPASRSASSCSVSSSSPSLFPIICVDNSAESESVSSIAASATSFESGTVDDGFSDSGKACRARFACRQTSTQQLYQPHHDDALALTGGPQGMHCWTQSLRRHDET
jgi:hypothetical protein